MKRFIALQTILLIAIFQLSAQESNELSFDEVEEQVNVHDAFNAPLIINTQSTNMTGQGELNFQISHRFGTFNQGAFNFFGMDYGAIRLGFEYGLRDNLRLGLGRSSIGKNYDMSVKYRLLSQTAGKKTIPITIALFSSVSMSSVDFKNRKEIVENEKMTDHLVYTSQLLLSRRFSSRFSLQATPTYIHYNTAIFPNQDNNLLAFGLGGRLFLGGKIHLTADYHYIISDKGEKYNPLAVGIDIVVGGHIFQVHVGNAVGMIEKEFIGATFDDIMDGDLRLGFTVFRTFNIRPKVEGGKIY